MTESQSDSPPPRQNDYFNARLWWGQVLTALAHLTRLRPGARERSANALILAARAFPLVGAALGLAGGLAYAIAFSIGLPVLVAALLGVGTLVFLTGALHEGQMSRLAEPRDESPIGALGVISLLLALGARVGSVADLERPGLVIAALVVAAAASRAAIPAAARFLLPPGTNDAEAESARPGSSDVLVAVLLAAGLSLIALGWSGLVALLAGAAGALALIAFARRRIAERADDGLGAIQQAFEVAFLAALAALR